MNLISFLILGLIAGWLAATIMKGRGAGMLVNLVLGVIGAYLGGFLFSLFGLSAHGFIGSLITATIGAVVLLFLINILKKA
jgi:uncharacterized membrane protein YeaQ/YmgE (transglycosylase-associated protein family)